MTFVFIFIILKLDSIPLPFPEQKRLLYIQFPINMEKKHGQSPIPALMIQPGPQLSGKAIKTQQLGSDQTTELILSLPKNNLIQP
jgi:hypothetical protein